MTEAQFEAWLVEQGYRESTRTQTMRQARQVCGAFQAQPEQPLPPSTLAACKRMLGYCEQTGDNPDLQSWLLLQGVTAPTKAVRAPRGPRKLTAESFPDGDYRSLLRACSGEHSPEAHVVYVLGTTGLRIGDVLRLPMVNLEAALDGAQAGGRGVLPLERKGGGWVEVPILGALDAWQRLYDAGHRAVNVAGYVTDGYSTSAQPAGAAYQRVHRWLQRLGQRLGLTGRVHLHRLRRTVAVRGLRATDGDLVAVSQMLGHASIVSTQKYVDEINVDRVADLQRKIREG